jgi:hypothetical protein
LQTEYPAIEQRACAEGAIYGNRREPSDVRFIAKAGDKVRFTVDQINGDYTVMSIEKSK